jgi:hypothetical protein
MLDEQKLLSSERRIVNMQRCVGENWDEVENREAMARTFGKNAWKSNSGVAV